MKSEKIIMELKKIEKERNNVLCRHQEELKVFDDRIEWLQLQCRHPENKRLTNPVMYPYTLLVEIEVECGVCGKDLTWSI